MIQYKSRSFPGDLPQKTFIASFHAPTVAITPSEFTHSQNPSTPMNTQSFKKKTNHRIVGFHPHKTTFIIDFCVTCLSCFSHFSKGSLQGLYDELAQDFNHLAPPTLILYFQLPVDEAMRRIRNRAKEEGRFFELET